MVSIRPDTHVFTGETVALVCGIQGENSTQGPYRWFKNNKSFTEKGSFIKTQDNLIWSVTISDTNIDNYTCSGPNSELSDPVTLTVSGEYVGLILFLKMY